MDWIRSPQESVLARRALKSNYNLRSVDRVGVEARESALLLHQVPTHGHLHEMARQPFDAMCMPQMFVHMRTVCRTGRTILGA